MLNDNRYQLITVDTVTTRVMSMFPARRQDASQKAIVMKHFMMDLPSNGFFSG